VGLAGCRIRRRGCDLFPHANAAQRCAASCDGRSLEALPKTQDLGLPSDPALLFTGDMLREDFAGLELDELAETETVMDEGPSHGRLAAAVRFTARRRSAQAFSAP
jgi:hypothetical protein